MDIEEQDSHTSSKVLKQNEYKCVELHTRPDGTQFISKRYSGHRIEYLRHNTYYVYAALQYFYGQFNEILTAPLPLAINEDIYQVEIEYLPGLPTAKSLTLQTISMANDFFAKCYQLRDDAGFLRPIDTSVVMTPSIKLMLDQGCPQSLGFKGDLKENLCINDEQLILADIDSIGMEPLGLSEVILYAEMFASTNFLPTLTAYFSKIPTPLAFRHMSKENSELLCQAAIERLEMQMQGLPSMVKKIKHSIASHLLKKTLNSVYS